MAGSQLAGTAVTLVKNYVAKEDSQPKYTEIVYQLLKTFIQAAVKDLWIMCSHLTIGEF